MLKVTLHQVLQILVGFSCIIIFGALTKTQTDVFLSEPTGTSLKWKSMDEIPFPAISICDKHYTLRKAFDDIGVPMNPFGGGPQEVTEAPMLLYSKLEDFHLDFMDNLWKYYFTLDNILSLYRGDPFSPLSQKCRVGLFSCHLDIHDAIIPTNGSRFVETEVEAGKWVSKFMADSYRGENHLCHTLVPNVSVDFAVNGGNSIAIKLNNVGYTSVSSYWSIYVHDKHEHVLIDSLAIETVPSLKCSKNANEETFTPPHKKKAKILPRLQELPSPSARLPCSEDESYSRNLCNLQWCWSKRVEGAEQKFGDRFTCELPGIWADESVRRPVCNHYSSSNSSAGILELMRDDEVRFTKNPLLLTSPAVGVYKETSNCIPRCSLYTYQLVEEQATILDQEMTQHDVFLYFPTNIVEHWLEYRLYSTEDFLSGLGGSLGLMLGLSVFSLFFVLVDTVQKTAIIFKAKLQKDRKESKRAQPKPGHVRQFHKFRA